MIVALMKIVCICNSKNYRDIEISIKLVKWAQATQIQQMVKTKFLDRLWNAQPDN